MDAHSQPLPVQLPALRLRLPRLLPFLRLLRLFKTRWRGYGSSRRNSFRRIVCCNLGEVRTSGSSSSAPVSGSGKGRTLHSWGEDRMRLLVRVPRGRTSPRTSARHQSLWGQLLHGIFGVYYHCRDAAKSTGVVAASKAIFRGRGALADKAKMANILIRPATVGMRHVYNHAMLPCYRQPIPCIRQTVATGEPQAERSRRRTPASHSSAMKPRQRHSHDVTLANTSTALMCCQKLLSTSDWGTTHTWTTFRQFDLHQGSHSFGIVFHTTSLSGTLTAWPIAVTDLASGSQPCPFT